jgi:hypothetical protein
MVALPFEPMEWIDEKTFTTSLVAAAASLSSLTNCILLFTNGPTGQIQSNPMRAPTPNDVGITQRLSYTLSWKWVKFLVLQNSYSKKNDVRKQLARSKAMYKHDIPLVEYEEDIDANRYKEDK